MIALRQSSAPEPIGSFHRLLGAFYIGLWVELLQLAFAEER